MARSPSRPGDSSVGDDSLVDREIFRAK